MKINTLLCQMVLSSLLWRCGVAPWSSRILATSATPEKNGVVQRELQQAGFGAGPVRLLHGLHIA